MKFTHPNPSDRATHAADSSKHDALKECTSCGILPLLKARPVDSQQSSPLTHFPYTSQPGNWEVTRLSPDLQGNLHASLAQATRVRSVAPSHLGRSLSAVRSIQKDLMPEQRASLRTERSDATMCAPGLNTRSKKLVRGKGIACIFSLE